MNWRDKMNWQNELDCARHGLRPRVGGREATAALDLAMCITRLIGEGNAKAALVNSP
jgi:hypothetical protein